jgi:signal transduction histidine kinase
MVRVTEDLLDLTRVRLGKLTLKREPMNLGELVSEVTRLRREGGLAARATVNVEVSPVWIEGDRARMEQVVSNLLDNALKFTAASGLIEVSVRRDGPSAVLRVADNGQGIPQESLAAVFQLFVQGEPGVALPQRGLGLGLALVQRLTELHGGKVSAASAGVGQGSTFTVSLPAIEPPPELRPSTPDLPRQDRESVP